MAVVDRFALLVAVWINDCALVVLPEGRTDLTVRSADVRWADKADLGLRNTNGCF